MKPALKEAFRQQHHAVFGNRRYWFHIVLWLLVVLVSFPYTSDFSQGFIMGVSVGPDQNSATVADKPSDPSGKLSSHFTDIFKDRSVLVADTVSGLVGAAIVIYVFLLVIIPYARYRQKKRILLFYLFLLLFLLFGAVFGTAVLWGILESRAQKMSGGAQSTYFPMAHIVLVGILVFITTAAFFSVYYFLELYDQQKTLNRYRQVFAARMQAETNFLKMQINPHFLFNSLNNIYALTLAQSPQAPVIARRLKELVHYMLDECTQETVPLSGELDFLKNYIALEQLRNSEEQVRINYEVRGEPDNLHIAPLLLVNFIENAFKHGVKAGVEVAEIRVRIDIVGRMLAMEVYNTKPPTTGKRQLAVKEAGGIGIQNVKRRLQILYPGRYSLRINDSQKGYFVYLNAQL
jgi:sensor histidine kinase YesM